MSIRIERRRKVKRVLSLAAVVAIVGQFIACPPSGLLTNIQEKVSAGSGGVATPTFSPGQGTYSSDTSVTVSDSTSGATIYYTTNGTTPTTTSTQYSGQILVAGNGTTETIEAIAIKSGMANTAVATATYVIKYSQVATPTFSPGQGTYSSDTSVTIINSTGGAKIYYTTNGTTPTTTSTQYSGQILVAGNGTTETIEAIAAGSGMANSQVASATYTINYSQVSTPAVSPNGGNTITQPETITLTDNTPGAAIYYTHSTNGIPPSPTNLPPASPWLLYNPNPPTPQVPIVGDDQTQWVIVAEATNSGMANSTNATSAVYTVSLAVPTISSVSSASSTTLTVNWSTVSGATGYNVFRDASQMGSFSTEVATNLSSTTTRYQDNGLSSGTIYWYKVQANYIGGFYNLLTRSVAASGMTVPSAPTGVVVGGATPVNLTISWNATSGTTGYNVLRSTSSSGPFATVATGLSSASYQDSGLSSGTTYWYEAQATNAGGVSALLPQHLERHSLRISRAQLEQTLVAASGSTVT